jgi:hypothetical protein
MECGLSLKKQGADKNLYWLLGSLADEAGLLSAG